MPQRFLPLQVPPLLSVPCAARPPFDEPRPKPEGTAVGAGEPLTEDAPDAGSEGEGAAPRAFARTRVTLQSPPPAALAPAAGQVVGTTRVSLLNAREVPAVLLAVLPAATDTAAEVPMGAAGTAERGEQQGSTEAGEEPTAPESSQDAAGEPPPPQPQDPPQESEVPPPAFAPLPLPAVRDLLSRLRVLDLAPTIDRLRAAGVWADRWTSPDLLGQLVICLRRQPEFILCSLLDPDPALGVNRACAEAFPEAVVAAVAALAKLTGAPRAWLAVDAAADESAWAGVRRVAAAVAGDLRLVPVDNDYPQPDPTLLIYALTGRRLPPEKLPIERGVLLLDAAAAVAVGRALVAGEPMLRVPFAVHYRTAAAREAPADAGDGFADAPAKSLQGVTHFVAAPVGSPLSDVLAQLGIAAAGGKSLEFRATAPLRELRVTGDCVISGSELGVLVAPREPDVNPDPCIRCGWCVEGCPTRCQPAGLLEAAQADDLPLARRYGLDACVECGICSYVCPSHLPLLHAIRTLRGEREIIVEE